MAMPPHEPSNAHEADSPPRFGQTLIDDLNRGDFGRTLQQDLRDVYQFYLDKESRARLDEMGPVNRWFYVTFWLLKNSILKLSPARRLLLLGCILFFINGFGGNLAFFVLGFVVLLLILLLELKDKLMAQDELNTGRAVQFALMPKDTPRIPGWEAWLYTVPANDVGGDLVDYLVLDDERVGFALGDVAGKGLGAALLMSKLQSTLRAIAPNYTALADLASATNAIFRRDGLPHTFISLIYLEVRADCGEVRLVNAGHLPPLLVGDGQVGALSKGGPAIGLMEHAPYEEQAITLEAGDYLVLFSDGVTEARNEAGAFFGQHRLAALVEALRGHPPDEMGPRLVRAIDRFVGDVRASDDLSIIILHRTRQSIESVAHDEAETETVE